MACSTAVVICDSASDDVVEVNVDCVNDRESLDCEADIRAVSADLFSCKRALRLGCICWRGCSDCCCSGVVREFIYVVPSVSYVWG